MSQYAGHVFERRTHLSLNSTGEHLTHEWRSKPHCDVVEADAEENVGYLWLAGNRLNDNNDYRPREDRQGIFPFGDPPHTSVHFECGQSPQRLALEGSNYRVKPARP